MDGVLRNMFGEEAVVAEEVGFIHRSTYRKEMKKWSSITNLAAR